MKKNEEPDSKHEGRDENFMDVDRMVNEGLGGGQVTKKNGLIEDTTTDSMDHPESVLDKADIAPEGTVKD